MGPSRMTTPQINGAQNVALLQENKKKGVGYADAPAKTKEEGHDVSRPYTIVQN